MTTPDGHHIPEPANHGADVVIVGDPASISLASGIGDVIVQCILPGVTVERALSGMQTGVVVVVVPPADDLTVRQVAALRRERTGIRAVLVNPAVARDQRLAALRAGFDESLPSELGAGEIAARVAIQLVRARAMTPFRLAVGAGVELDPEARALRRRGRLVHLRPLEFRLLEELARAPGRPLSRAWLIDRAWGAAPPTGSRTIDVHVRWLREKIERDPHRPVHLLTVRGIGYQLEPHEPDDPRPPSKLSTAADG